MSELHSPVGRLNAVAIAKFLGVPLSEIVAAVYVNYTALQETPDSALAQPALALFKRILVILTEMLGGPETVRAWLNSPHPDLGNRTPISVMLGGHADAVLTILEMRWPEYTVDFNPRSSAASFASTWRYVRNPLFLVQHRDQQQYRNDEQHQ